MPDVVLVPKIIALPYDFWECTNFIFKPFCQYLCASYSHWLNGQGNSCFLNIGYTLPFLDKGNAIKVSEKYILGVSYDFLVSHWR